MCTISRGEHRLVVAVPPWGIAIKLPRLALKRENGGDTGPFRLTVVLGGFWSEVWITLRPWRRGWYFYDRLHWLCFVGEKVWLALCRERFFVAMTDNWREWQYYANASSLKRRLLKPTHFSLLGLLNIQTMGCPSTESNYVVQTAFHLAAGNAVYFERHHLQNAGNFDNFAEGLCFLDYGSVGVQKFIDEYAMALLDTFDLEAGRTELQRVTQEIEEDKRRRAAKK